MDSVVVEIEERLRAYEDPIEVVGAGLRGQRDRRGPPRRLRDHRRQGRGHDLLARRAAARRCRTERLVDELFAEIDRYYAARQDRRARRGGGRRGRRVAASENEDAAQLTPERIAALEEAAADGVTDGDEASGATRTPIDEAAAAVVLLWLAASFTRSGVPSAALLSTDGRALPSACAVALPLLARARRRHRRPALALQQKKKKKKKKKSPSAVQVPSAGRGPSRSGAGTAGTRARRAPRSGRRRRARTRRERRARRGRVAGPPQRQRAVHDRRAPARRGRDAVEHPRLGLRRAAAATPAPGPGGEQRRRRELAARRRPRACRGARRRRRPPRRGCRRRRGAGARSPRISSGGIATWSTPREETLARERRSRRRRRSIRAPSLASSSVAPGKKRPGAPPSALSRSIGTRVPPGAGAPSRSSRQRRPRRGRCPARAAKVAGFGLPGAGPDRRRPSPGRARPGPAPRHPRDGWSSAVSVGVAAAERAAGDAHGRDPLGVLRPRDPGRQRRRRAP